MKLNDKSFDEISNQAAKIEAAGPETRDFQLETIRKLHEHMVQLSPVLESLLTEEELMVNVEVRYRINQMSLKERTTFVVK